MAQEGQTQKIGFGYVDDTSDDLKTKSGGKFGLNQGVFLTKFELNKNAGKDKSEQDALDYEIQIKDASQSNRVYPTDRVFDGDGNEITDKNSQAYTDGYNEDWKHKNALIIHILKNFRSDEEVRQAFSVPINSFADFINIAAGLLPENFASKPLDTFLEWQWKIPKGKDQTYLQLPQNMKGGAWLVPHMQAEGEWLETITEDGLKYVDSKNGREHAFTRSSNFMESPKAKQQRTGQQAANNALQNAAGTGDAKKSGW